MMIRGVANVQSHVMTTTCFFLLTVALLLGTSDAQLKECVNEKNLQNCPTLTQTTLPVPQCGPDACYNYCNSLLVGCCPKFALSCAVNCPAMVGPIVITAGCRLPNTTTAAPVPPSPPPPTPPPSPRPPTRAPIVIPPSSGPPKICPLEENTANCPALVKNQTVVEACGADGCYNYCNGVYAGCCRINVGCSLSCSSSGTGSTAPPIVATAGCRLNITSTPTRSPTRFPTKSPTKAPTKSPTKAPTKSPTKSPTKRPTRRPSAPTQCKVGGQSCTTFGQCCSQRCRSGFCV